jgi:hypothetical protein
MADSRADCQFTNVLKNHEVVPPLEMRQRDDGPD